MIPKSDIITADSYQGYIDLVKEDNIREAIARNTKQFRKALDSIPRKNSFRSRMPGHVEQIILGG